MAAQRPGHTSTVRVGARRAIRATATTNAIPINPTRKRRTGDVTTPLVCLRHSLVEHGKELFDFCLGRGRADLRHDPPRWRLVALTYSEQLTVGWSGGRD